MDIGVAPWPDHAATPLVNNALTNHSEPFISILSIGHRLGPRGKRRLVSQGRATSPPAAVAI